MAIEVGKPDYYIILKKRRKTVERLLQENDVDTKEKLEVLVAALEGEHLISLKFREEAEEYLAKVVLEKKQKQAKPKRKSEKPKVVAEKEPEESENPEEKVEAPKPKPKRRPRRSPKKSTTAKKTKTKDDSDSSE